jgi:hypothetical protein
MDNDANLIIKSAFNKLNTTKTGAKLISILNKNPNTYTITILQLVRGNPSTYGSYYNSETRVIYIDPYHSTYIHIDDGKKGAMELAPKTVTLAHELGHATGTKEDDGKGTNMLNSTTWENPVRKDLGLPLRKTYKSPSWFTGVPIAYSTAI